MNCRDGLQKGQDSVCLLATDDREMRIWQRGIEMLSARRDSIVQRTVELVIGPGADPIVPIAGKVGRIDDAKRD